MVTRADNPSISDAEAGELQVQRQPGSNLKTPTAVASECLPGETPISQQCAVLWEGAQRRLLRHGLTPTGSLLAGLVDYTRCPGSYCSPEPFSG